MEEIISKYLDALTACVISGKTQKGLRLNGYRRTEYEKEMNDLYQAFRLAVLSGSYSVPEFISITRKVEEAKKQIVHFQKIVERTGTDTPLFRPLYSLFGTYRRQVEKTAELVEGINIVKLSQAASVPQPAPVAKETTPEKLPVVLEETSPAPTTAPVPEKKERRTLLDKSTPDPRYYLGLKEMEAGEHISHTTAVKIHKDPYFKPAFTEYGKIIRVNVDVLHELGRKKAMEKNKPIGTNPRRGKK